MATAMKVAGGIVLGFVILIAGCAVLISAGTSGGGDGGAAAVTAGRAILASMSPAPRRSLR